MVHLCILTDFRGLTCIDDVSYDTYVFESEPKVLDAGVSKGFWSRLLCLEWMTYDGYTASHRKAHQYTAANMIITIVLCNACTMSK